ncbi:MAG: membrane protein insertion efficiency factor YidD [Patulibacter sp.]
MRNVAPAIRSSAGDGGNEPDGCCAGQDARSRPLLRQIVLAPIFAYQRWLSPAIGARCRFTPSCSHYAVQAIDQYGILRGLVLAAWRVARCNPFGGQGIDRPEDQRLFPLTGRTKRVPHA